MSVFYNENGYNMFDMLSMVQKSIRRGLYEYAAFAANQLRISYRTALWNRLMVISAEDCYGAITKEVVFLRCQDAENPDDQNISNTLKLLCDCRKNRDACYFACNFVLYSFCPRGDKLKPTADDIKNILDLESPPQETLYDTKVDPYDRQKAILGANLKIALDHRDMEMAGHEIDILRGEERDFLWKVLMYAAPSEVLPEINGLHIADGLVNKRKSADKRDEIFLSKAAMIILHHADPAMESVESQQIRLDHLIDWTDMDVPSIREYIKGDIPDWVYDCHTLKGKKMGKTDWDMTITEQKALTPLVKAYFDDASWMPTYTQDFVDGVITVEQMEIIKSYARCYDMQDNPVPHIPYEYERV